ncbi:MAG TPA: SIR2 family protein [Longimicrobium sp.]|jgi:hypothetical protein
MLKKLSELFRRDDTILYVGAGISTWSGLPTWRGLVQELAIYLEEQGQAPDLVRREIERNDLLQAASFGVDLLTPQQFAEFIRRVTRWGEAGPHDVHERLLAIPVRCFVTTNYDRLLEDALQRWRPGQHYRVVTNTQLAETADIVQARATDFVFKPHGDVLDSASIILTREQYRLLHGEKKHVLHSLSTLLISRPVVFVGFGLRDPDFIYVKDLLSSTYRGGARDLYAIVPDADPAEVDYWRRQYGVHLVSYETYIDTNGAPNHSGFLELITAVGDQREDSLAHSAGGGEHVSHQVSPTDGAPSSAESLLALARHAARFSAAPPSPSERLPIAAVFEGRRGSAAPGVPWRFEGARVEEILADFPGSAIIVGSPGAGKTHALTEHCADEARKLHAALLEEEPDVATLRVPIYVDLKLYSGSLWHMIESNLPRGLTLETLVDSGIARFVLDSFNEMPREQMESGAYESDFSNFLRRTSGCRIIIASRTTDGLDRFELPVLRLDALPSEYIAERLRAFGVDAEAISNPMRRFLAKPFFFRLLTGTSIQNILDESPRSIVESYFQRMSVALMERFGCELQIEDILAGIAYGALEDGTEAIPVSAITEGLRQRIEQAELPIEARDLENWLIGAGVLVPVFGSKLAFSHQILTEHLAAKQLSHLYSAAPNLLERHTRTRRWDQALFLTLGFLDAPSARRFVRQVMRVDLFLAVRAAAYLEHGRADVVREILAALVEHDFPFFNQEISVGFALNSLPVEPEHEELLWQIVERGNLLGAGAFELLAQMFGAEQFDRLLDVVFLHANDWNFCSSGGRALQEYVTEKHLPKIRQRLDQVAAEIWANPRLGLHTGIAELVARLDARAVYDALCGLEASGAADRLIGDVLYHNESSEATELSARLVADGNFEAAFALYSGLHFGGHDLRAVDQGELLIAVSQKIIEALLDGELGQSQSWAIHALQHVATQSSAVRLRLQELLATTSGVIRAVVANCAGQTEVLWGELDVIASNASGPVSNSNYLNTLEDLEWAEHRDTLLRLICSEDHGVSISILSAVRRLDSPQLALCPDEVLPLLRRLLELCKGDSDSSTMWHATLLGEFLGGQVNAEARQLLVEAFNTGDLDTRRALSHHVLQHTPNLSTAELSPPAISYLLEELQSGDRARFHRPLLGLLATEEFVENSLLPLASGLRDEVRKSLRDVLDAAGSRHGRRYALA